MAKKDLKQSNELSVELMEINSLIEAEYNPRELTDKQYLQLKDSLLRFGVIDPVLVNVNPERENIIIGGHQRTKVWRDLGNTTIPCIKLNLSAEQEKELNIRLNKNTGQFDKDALNSFFDREELIDWGFEEWEFGIQEDVDYSILDEEDFDDDLENELDEMTNGVKKAIQIEFEPEHYEEASEIVRFWREQEGYVGGMILEHLKAEKEKLI